MGTPRQHLAYTHAQIGTADACIYNSSKKSFRAFANHWIASDFH